MPVDAQLRKWHLNQVLAVENIKLLFLETENSGKGNFFLLLFFSLSCGGKGGERVCNWWQVIDKTIWDVHRFSLVTPSISFVEVVQMGAGN